MNKLFLIGPKYDAACDYSDYTSAASYWRNLGHTVVSSLELDVADGANPDYGWNAEALDATARSDIFRRDVSELVACDAVVLLGGWEDDSVCHLLANIAHHADMTAWDYIDGDHYYADPSEVEDVEFFTADNPPRDTFQDVINQVVELHNKKNKDYGKGEDPFYNLRAAERYGIPAWVSCMIRSDDKSHRIQKAFVDGIDSLVNESVIDSFQDKIVYDILALVLFYEAQAANE